MSKNTETKQYSMNEVIKHNTKKDCWIVVNGKVYDITKFIEEDLHPGGNYILISKAGEDVTQAINDIGHSKEAFDMMNIYYIGDLI